MAEKYTKYDAIEFAEDPSFISWVKQKDPKAKRFWEDWQKNHPEKAKELKEATVLVKSISFKEEEPTKNRIDNLWDKIEAETSVSAQPISKVRRLTVKWISYAAAASVAAILFFYFYSPVTTLNVGNGERLAYQLPDNSTVELNADSKISFKRKAWSDERIVELEGEAFFDVEKGSTFKVITPSGQVEVLGTSFNVNTRNNELSVKCKTGRVRVTAQGDEKILTPGKATKTNKDKPGLELVYDIDVNQAIGWRDGNYYFQNVPLKVAFEEMERQYDVTIQASSAVSAKLGSWLFSGDLNNALKQVCFPNNLSFKEQGKTVIISESE